MRLGYRTRRHLAPDATICTRCGRSIGNLAKIKFTQLLADLLRSLDSDFGSVIEAIRGLPFGSMNLHVHSSFFERMTTGGIDQSIHSR